VAAEALGTALAERGVEVVYGGGRVGLMGMLADAALRAGGRVTGVIPEHLVGKEVGHSGLTELVVVDTMHDRKLAMADRAQAFIALPGGAGTFEELFEVYTWTQLGLHQKPVGLLDVAGFYAPLLAFLDSVVDAGFIRPPHRAQLLASDDIDTLLAEIVAWEPVEIGKWLDLGDR
jgi:uncharacterized protein (TIGR00730 family)